MNETSLIAQQKNGILLHRLVYGLFAGLRIFLQMQNRQMQMKNTVYILSFVLLCEVFEEVFYRTDYFKSERLIRVFRYVQCLLSSLLLCFLEIHDAPNVAIVALIILFLVDYFLSMQMVDVHSLITYMLSVGIPIAAIIIAKMSFSASDDWIVLFFDMILLFVVLFSSAYALVEYVNGIEMAYFTQCNELDDIVRKNEEIVAVWDKLQETNYTLNTQKNDLENANRKIKQANEEMAVQAQILNYIAMSFDFPKISNQILDSIMQVKQLGFCAVYVRKNVYRNRHANYVIKTDIGQLQSKLRDNMDNIYEDMVAENRTEIVYHSELKAHFPFLKEVNINSMYMRVLHHDGEPCGLFMLGDSHATTFDSNMSFYDAIIAQYDVAVGNAQIYGNMQYMAQKDGLTGINNRIHFTELFQSEVERLRDGQGDISVALLDIDKFKSVNDTYGHLAGDEVIKRIASVTEEVIDKYNGFVCRYGGEEFVAVLPDRKLEVATPIIEELFDRLCSQVVMYNGTEIHMSVSVGLTAYPEVCDNPDELLKRADWCMYYSKEHGRHQIKVDDGSIRKE